MDEKDLIEQVKQNDQKAFEQLVHHYKPYVEKLAFQFGMRPDSIPDVVQETFMKVHHHLHRYSRGKFSTWLYQVTLNVVRDHHRKKKREWKLFNKVAEENHLWRPQHFYFEKEEYDTLHEAIKQLDENYRLPIILFYFHDQSYEEIALILKIKRATVKTRMHRGRNKLKGIYEELEQKEAETDGRQTLG